MLFLDRTDAGRRLADRLSAYREERPVVLALPRGGVVVGYEVAKALGAPLDVVVARKLGAPAHPEFGIGAIAEGGVRVVDEETVRALGIAPDELERVVAAEAQELERRVRRYRGGRARLPTQGQTVILVDDGLATGVTARAAIQAAQQAGPARLILAVPVCARETADALLAEIHDVVCVATPLEFWAVGAWYVQFEPTTDEQVVELLERARREIAGIGREG